MTTAVKPTLRAPTDVHAPPRVIIEGITPIVDGGSFPIKRAEGEFIDVGADVFAEGHEILRVLLKHRHIGDSNWIETPMAPLGNDRWEGRFQVERLGRYEYTIEGWVDRFRTWKDALIKKHEAGQDIASELVEGAQLIEQAARRANGPDRKPLQDAAEAVSGRASGLLPADRVTRALDAELGELMDRHADRSNGWTFEPVLEVVVDPVLAARGAWYEMFPRSASDEPGRHGTFRDVEARLPYVAGMGFDILYLPPIHPIGRSFRKGPNNALESKPDDPGSPWAIGSEEGGHTAIHPELGTFEDFDHLVKAAEQHGLKVALDIAFQCSPDHPWVKEHPEWFRHRPDGSIKYAENPPKKYQDIYPLEFEGPAWRSLWEALRDVFLFWAERGVTIFRVDNPHTKPFGFWDWCIDEIKERYPEAIFLSEAFTRPKVMKRLAKGGFTQSYTYFTWRNTKADLVEYLTELSRTECREYMRPNFFANTPDILHEYLQTGGPAAFQIRFVLASTLAASYGIYGPPFEQCIGLPLRPGSEEYLHSEKYQIRHWDLNAPGNLSGFIRRVNQIRQEHPALQNLESLRFHHVDNDQLIAYSKTSRDGSDRILVFVNLDPRHAQSGWTSLNLEDLALAPHDEYTVRDLLDGAEYRWHGPGNFVMLDPNKCPAHIFQLVHRAEIAAT